MVRKNFIISLIIVILCMMNTSVFAGELYSVDVRQVYCFSDLFRVYADIEDIESNPVNKPNTSDIAGYIDGNKLTVKNVQRFGDTNEGVADIFLVDISGSMGNNQMVQVKEAIKTWAANMKENDRIAVITFGDEAKCILDYTNDKTVIDKAVDSVTNNDMKTRLFGGIDEALKLATRNDSSLAKRKNIILITDGINDYSGGISENDIYSKLKESLIPVYSMWMPSSGTNGQRGRATLNSITEYSGGEIYDMSNKQINVVYDWIYQSIRNSYTVDFAYGTSAADDGVHNFNIKVAQGDKVAEDSISFNYRKTDEKSGAYSLADTNAEQNSDSEDSDNNDNKKFIIIFSVILFILAVGILLTVIFIKKKQSSTKNYYDNESFFNGGFGNSDNIDYVNSYNDNNMSYQTMDATMNVNNSGEVILTSIADGMEKRAVISSPVRIGRGPNNEIVIDDSLVSERHCVITAENGNAYIEDLNSTNGTILNGMIITNKTLIRNNDVIRIGSRDFRITLNF